MAGQLYNGLEGRETERRGLAYSRMDYSLGLEADLFNTAAIFLVFGFLVCILGWTG